MGAAAAKEGSMEEILASIRKIISSDAKKVKKAEGKKDIGQIDVPEPVIKPEMDTASAQTTGEVSSEAAVKPDPQPTAQAPKPIASMRSPAENSQPASGSLAAVAASVATGEAKPTPAKPEVERAAELQTGEKSGSPEKIIETPQETLKSLSETVNEMGISGKAEDKTTNEFKEALVSPSTQAAVSGSIDRLKKSVANNQAAHVEAVLRPMLKEWLDANLPEMVEKIVREEVDRISKSDVA